MFDVWNLMFLVILVRNIFNEILVYVWKSDFILIMV